MHLRCADGALWAASAQCNISWMAYFHPGYRVTAELGHLGQYHRCGGQRADPVTGSGRPSVLGAELDGEEARLALQTWVWNLSTNWMDERSRIPPAVVAFIVTSLDAIEPGDLGENVRRARLVVGAKRRSTRGRAGGVQGPRRPARRWRKPRTCLSHPVPRRRVHR